jgi:hypothetical protein
MPLVMTPLGIGSAQLAAVQLFPNPFSSRITVTGAGTVKEIVVSSILGQNIIYLQNNNNESFEIPTDKLSAGVYLITLIGNNNEQRVAKMVKK